jgi:hypothetical protein
MRTAFTWTQRGALAALGAAALLAAGCDGSSNAGADAAAGGGDSPNGVVLGPLDNHCSQGDAGLRAQEIGVCEVIDPSSVPTGTASCDVSFTQDAGMSTANADAGADAGADTGGGDYGPTNYGSAADDDDCKYFVSWVSTPIQENADTYFTVTAIRLSDGKPAHCAGVRPDVSLTLTHGAPAPRAPAPEIAPGVYRVGPIRFDAPGKWTVRFHLYEECDDTPEDSPHGHAAFYVAVP